MLHIGDSSRPTDSAGGACLSTSQLFRSRFDHCRLDFSATLVLRNRIVRIRAAGVRISTFSLAGDAFGLGQEIFTSRNVPSLLGFFDQQNTGRELPAAGTLPALLVDRQLEG
jgi:hypothetical protein